MSDSVSNTVNSAISSNSSASQNDAGDQVLFKSFMLNKKVVVADTVTASRNSMCAILVAMGVKKQNIILVPTFEFAQEEIKKSKPYLVITDYHLGDQPGLALASIHRKAVEKDFEPIFVLLASTVTESSIAEAAEEDVNAYILKPFEADKTRERIFAALMAQLQPSKYLKTLKEGKVLYQTKHYDEALVRFDRAIPLSDRPSLAHYYAGATLDFKEQDLQSHSHFQKGLSINERHYKCLLGLFNLNYTRKSYLAAHTLAIKIAETFPVTPTLLEEFIKLANESSNYSELDQYIKVYDSLFYKPRSLTEVMNKALVQSGRVPSKKSA